MEARDAAHSVEYVTGGPKPLVNRAIHTKAAAGHHQARPKPNFQGGRLLDVMTGLAVLDTAFLDGHPSIVAV